MVPLPKLIQLRCGRAKIQTVLLHAYPTLTLLLPAAWVREHRTLLVCSPSLRAKPFQSPVEAAYVFPTHIYPSRWVS